MAKVFIEESTLTKIGNSIRNKTGKTELIDPAVMDVEIDSIVSGGGGETNQTLFDIIERDVEIIKAEDLYGVTKIGTYAFENCQSLTSVELPSTVTELDNNIFASCSNLFEFTIPRTVNKMIPSTFDNSSIRYLTIEKDDEIYDLGGQVQPGNITSLQTIYASGKILDSYLSADDWKLVSNLFVPFDEYVFNPKVIKILQVNDIVNISIPLTNFDYVPQVQINNDYYVTIDDLNVTNTEITFTLQAGQLEITGTLPISIIRNDGHVFERPITYKIVEELVESTYEVVSVDGVTYGFELNENGYYESTNKGVSDSYAYCRVNISNSIGRKLIFECINYAESNYDFGIFSNVNQELSLNSSADGTHYFSFNGIQSPNVVNVEYTDAINDCFITIKFRKDSSGDNDYDSLQFKIRFE